MEVTQKLPIFAQEDLLTLIATFNRQVGNRRGLDVSAIYDGTAISFAKHIVMDEVSTLDM